MELFELLEWLLPTGTQAGKRDKERKVHIETIATEDGFFSFIQEVLQPYLHDVLLLIGITDANGMLTHWWKQKQGNIQLMPLPERVKSAYLEENISHVLTLYKSGRQDVLMQTFYRSGVKELTAIPLQNNYRRLGYLFLLSEHHGVITDEVLHVLKKEEEILSAVFMKLLLLHSIPLWLHHQPAVVIDSSLLPVRLIGGKALRPVLQQVLEVAPTEATVLLTGETGTGKEIFAEAIHHASPRREKVFIKVNCAALPAELIESELFGHEKGAFTGAVQRRTGKFEMADGGTIFLDEIGELPLESQAKLLRVLQEKVIEPVGSNQSIQVDVRIIAATNRILEDEVREGRFRQDLYYRLYVFPVHLPALRERKEDIPLLLQHFARKMALKYEKPFKPVAPGSLPALLDYSWPGNIREMEHMVERAVIAGNSRRTELVIEPPVSKGIVTSHTSQPVLSLADVEKEAIIRALRYCNGRVRGPQGAAEILDIKPTTLEARMKKLGIVKEHVIK